MWNNNERERGREKENSPANATEMNMKAHLFTHTHTVANPYELDFRFFPLHIRVRIKNRSWKWKKGSNARFSIIVVLCEAAAHFTRSGLAHFCSYSFLTSFVFAFHCYLSRPIQQQQQQQPVLSNILVCLFVYLFAMYSRDTNMHTQNIDIKHTHSAHWIVLSKRSNPTILVYLQLV